VVMCLASACATKTTTLLGVSKVITAYTNHGVTSSAKRIVAKNRN